jgi:hypothetical protein
MCWYGDIASIPAGWVLCDGTNGTPDLRGRVPFGVNTADNDFNTLGKMGGSKTHTHPLSYPNGTTRYFVASDPVKYYYNPGGTNSPWLQPDTAANSPTVPPYVALHYIMKV